MTKIIQRHDTAANWTSVNPTLSQGEFGVETDTGKFKIGDGQTVWTSLPYASSGEAVGSGLEVCDIGMALYVDETKGLRRYLNGQIVDNNKNTKVFIEDHLLGLYATNPEYFTTEDNWQAEALLNIDGCVYKFVLNYSGADVVSVRLPKYPDYVEINAGGVLPVVGTGKTLGLTDGTHNVGIYSFSGLSGSPLNASTLGFNVKPSTSVPGTSGRVSNGLYGVVTDPKKSGIQTTLKQTKLKMRYFIQIATGSETENNIINEIELNNPYSLFDSKYSDHELNNLSWLKSEGQWNAKAVYPTVYDKLLKVYNGTETVEGLSVKLSAEDYTDYDFVINTTDEMFRLPLSNNQRFVIETYTDGVNGYRIWSDGYCEQWGFAQATNSSDITVNIDLFKSYIDTDYNFISSNQYKGNDNTAAGFRWSCAYEKKTTSTVTVAMLGLDKVYGRTWTARGYLASGEYTPQNLYYYVGETVQNANLIDAGRIGEQLASKQDKLIRYPIEISDKSLMPSWYVVYNDGWCEQGGYLTSDGDYYFIKSFVSTPNLTFGNISSLDGYPRATVRKNTYFHYQSSNKANVPADWVARGYIS